MAKITDRLVDECRKRFEAGEPGALLDAVDCCARTGTAMPEWLAEAYCAGYAAWQSYQVKTLDQAFSVERKGERMPDRRMREWLKPRVVMEVDKLRRQQNLPVDEALFGRVGKALSIQPGMARDIYYKDNGWRKFLEVAPRNPPPDLPKPTHDQPNPAEPHDDS
jgi:hypothetical protein